MSFISMDRIRNIFSEGGILQESLTNYEEREEQILMSEAVHELVRNRGQLLVEAGCGVGKSFAYLVPLSLSLGTHTIVSTATRALQEQLYYKDIPVIKEHIRPGLHCVYLKGRSNYLCQYRLEHSRQYSLFDTEEFIEQFGLIQKWAKKTSTGDVAELEKVSESSDAWKTICCTIDTCLGYMCPYYEKTCFLMQIKREAKQADIIIVNHHLFFADLMIRNGNGGRAVLPQYQAVVFDEAHMLEDIATHFLGKAFGTWEFKRFVSRLKVCAREYFHNQFHVKHEILDYADKSLGLLDDFFASFPTRLGSYNIDKITSNDYYARGQRFITILLEISSFLSTFTKKVEEIVIFQEEIKKYITHLSFFLNAEEETYVYWFKIGRVHRTVYSSPIDVSPMFKEKIINDCSRVILTSATLSVNGDFSYVASRLGLEDASTIVIDSPYDFKKQVNLYIPTHIPSPKSKDFPQRFAEVVYTILLQTQGRAFVLFTSYKNMEVVYDIISAKNLPYLLLRQGEIGRAYLIKKFIENISSVLFATSTYWQGIDVPGESLSCVIMDKIPFAVPNDPVIYNRMKQVEREGRNSFYEYQIPQAALALRQGAGRLIRGHKDTGVIVIGDKRIVSTTYGKVFVRSLPSYSRIDNIEDVVVPVL